MQFRVAGAVALFAVLAGLSTATGRASDSDSCPNGDCLSLTVVPGTVSVGQEGVAVARFVNLGDKTLDEVEIRFTAIGSTLGEISTTFPGAECDSRGCEVGPLAPSASATVFGLFSASVSGSVVATAESDDEDELTAADDDDGGVTKQAAILVSRHRSSVGDCLFADDSPLTSVSTDRTQRVKVSFAEPADGFPCAPVDASISSTPPPGFTEKLVTVNALYDPSIFGTVVLDFATLPEGVDYHSFTLRELLNDTSPAGPHTLIVAPCGPDGRPQSSDHSLSSDSCVALRRPYLTDGARLTLHVLGTGQDPGYVG